MTSFKAKHGRPKPPPINSDAYAQYQRIFHTYGVWRSRIDWGSDWKPWMVDMPAGYEDFPTHAEAVQYAHKLAYERSQQ